MHYLGRNIAGGNRKQNALEWSFGHVLSLRCPVDMKVQMEVGLG